MTSQSDSARRTARTTAIPATERDVRAGKIAKSSRKTLRESAALRAAESQPGASVNSGTPRRWELFYDDHPPGPNDRLHFMARASLTRHWRALTALKCEMQGIPRLQRVRLSAVFLRERLGVADEDNDRARLKPLVDGLVGAGVLVRDTRGHVEWGAVTEERGARGVKFIVEEI